MKQIIRSNAVETLSPRRNLGIQRSDLHFRQASGESLVLSPTVNLSVLPQSSDVLIKNKSNKSTSWENKALSAFVDVVWEKKLDFLPRVVVWECIGKIAQVSNIPGKQITTQITTLITKTLGKMKARSEQATPSSLVLKVSLWKLLPNLQTTNQLAVKIAKTKTLLHSIWMQRTQQSSFRNSFFALNYGNC
ncbi:hypothetical protein [Sphaerospermopsis torques-reginae]|uniref:Uncharacterized protein n=1 Tax=Sphaerospermopsis torques-reginae ITEP-024 TaxID=984208 RepID=A0ABX8X4V0_9CYAN|nr:hypothetical protein [Sphaerospermopsis torques-reginae]QYX33724.1 hypothetical protein K2F26_10710 [Sphaerospermopsis torques-reginae ITEP-024]